MTAHPSTHTPRHLSPQADVPWRIVCQRCSRWDPVILRKVDMLAMNRVLGGGPTTGVETTCQRFASGTYGVLRRCGGQLLVEP